MNTPHRTDAEIVALMKEWFGGEPGTIGGDYGWGDCAHLKDEWIVEMYHDLIRRLSAALAIPPAPSDAAETRAGAV